MKVTSNFNFVAEELEDLADRIDRNIGMVTKYTAGHAYESLTQDPLGNAGTGTPRLTRRATNGWNMRAYPVVSYVEDGPKEYPAPESKQQAMARIPDGTMSVSIANGVPYIEDLNSGTSRKAPGGFVERAVNRAVNWLAGRNILDPNFVKKRG
jgi:hypothetical protein